MINHIEKGLGLVTGIRSLGYRYEHVDGVPTIERLDKQTINTTDETIVNDFIVAYDPVPLAKTEKIAELKSEAARRANVIYGFLSEDDGNTKASDVQAFYNFAVDIYTSIIPAARGTLAPRLQSFKGIRDTTVASVSAINALNTYDAVLAYDVVNTPAWP